MPRIPHTDFCTREALRDVDSRAWFTLWAGRDFFTNRPSVQLQLRHSLVVECQKLINNSVEASCPWLRTPVVILQCLCPQVPSALTFWPSNTSRKRHARRILHPRGNIEPGSSYFHIRCYPRHLQIHKACFESPRMTIARPYQYISAKFMCAGKRGIRCSTWL